MKTIFLSFTPEPFYKPLKEGVKRYEYRSRFTSEECNAYLYLSAPVQQVVAKTKFGKRIELKKWKVEFENHDAAMSRLKSFEDDEGKRYAIPILEFQEIIKVSLKDMREQFPEFNPPRSYLILDNQPEVLNFLEKIESVSEKLVHDLSIVEPWEVCIY